MSVKDILQLIRMNVMKDLCDECIKASWRRIRDNEVLEIIL